MLSSPNIPQRFIFLQKNGVEYVKYNFIVTTNDYCLSIVWVSEVLKPFLENFGQLQSGAIIHFQNANKLFTTSCELQTGYLKFPRDCC